MASESQPQEELQRIAARAFLALMNPEALEFWRSMPVDWTDVTTLVNGRKLSTVSMLLGRLYRAGAVSKKRASDNGQRILYRPSHRVDLKLEVSRGV